MSNTSNTASTPAASTAAPSGSSAAPPTPSLGDDLLSDAKQALSDALVTALKQYNTIFITGVQNVQTVPDMESLGESIAQTKLAIINGLPGLEHAELQVLAGDAEVALQQVGQLALTKAQGLAPGAAAS